MQLLYCPFCGKVPDMEDPDTMYPSGTGWKVRDSGLREYVHLSEVPREQWCFKIVCVETSGGCGAEMHGDTKEETIAKWGVRRDC